MTPKTIGIIAPGGACNPTDLSKAITLLQHQWGIKTTHPENLLDEHPLYAAPNPLRYQNLRASLTGDQDILWALRGGCGSSSMVHELIRHQLDLSNYKPKTIIGFSDITAILLFVKQAFAWQPIHGPVLRSLVTDELSEGALTCLKELITLGSCDVFCDLKPLNGYRDIDISAPLTGGNLALCQRSIGTKWQLDIKRQIVFFEDINEPPYRVAETLDHLNHALDLSQAQSILFGDFSAGNMTNNITNQGSDWQDALQTVFNDFARKVEIPVFSGLSVGHCPDNYPVQLGKKAHIKGLSFHQSLSLS